jgi:hypothetical protein
LPGRRSKVAVALLTAWLMAGCGGSGPALVDSSTTRPVPTTAATATTRPGTTAVPTTGAIPTTTGRVPVTTGQTGPAGAPLTFRRLTIRLGRGWRAGGGGEGCPQDRDGLAEVTPTKPAKRGVAKVGGKDAVYREWRVSCVDARTGEPEASYTQRVWYLKASKILVVDEWSTPGLGEALAAAKFG